MLDEVCFPSQTFVRLAKHLIAGIVEESKFPQGPAIYVWQECVDGIYHYIGDTTFSEKPDKSVVWSTHVAVRGEDNNSFSLISTQTRK